MTESEAEEFWTGYESFLDCMEALNGIEREVVIEVLA